MNDLRPLSEWVGTGTVTAGIDGGRDSGGTISALLTAQAVANDGLPLIGWVANRINPGPRALC